MKPWTATSLEVLPGKGQLPSLYDSASGSLTIPRPQDNTAGLYVCGITPYDATHLGHAYTYLAFDTLNRAWRDCGLNVEYVQNITDVDDPLLERANQTHIDWRELASSQVELFRSDMTALSILPPSRYLAVTETIDLIAEAVSRLLSSDLAYRVPLADAPDVFDIYFDTRAAARRTVWELGQISGLELEDMVRLSAERGGDPTRPGKRNPLDPCLWLAPRDGEPSWSSHVGPGRPGWHIECSAIALETLGIEFAVQGGGMDLLFPHHEFSAAHASALSHQHLAQVYAHAGLVSYHGEKMSKSRGNLVFVSALLNAGVEPSVIRLALLSHHYRSSWEWFDDMVPRASARLAHWRERASDRATFTNPEVSARDILERMRVLLSSDLDTPGMLDTLDAAFQSGVDDPDLLLAAARTLLGLEI